MAESLTFSPNGRRLAYGAAVDTQTFVVVDGQEGPRYDALVPDSVRFSPIASALPTAHARASSGRSYSMGSPGNFTGIGAGSLVFSPNGQRLAYVAQVGKQQVVVVDGQASKPYKGIAVGSLVFSADSQHVAYAANDEAKDTWFVVLDGQAGKPYEAWGGPVFIPTASVWPMPPPWMRRNRWWWSMAVRVRHITASRWACWPSVQTVGTWRMALRETKAGSWCWTITRVNPTKACSAWEAARSCLTPQDRFHYLATRGQDIYVVQEQLK